MLRWIELLLKQSVIHLLEAITDTIMRSIIVSSSYNQHSSAYVSRCENIKHDLFLMSSMSAEITADDFRALFGSMSEFLVNLFGTHTYR